MLGVIVVACAIAVWQGRPDPLAAYGAVLAAATLGLQLQRRAGERPNLQMIAEADKVGHRDVLLIHAYNASGGDVTVQALGFGAGPDDASCWQFGVNGGRAAGAVKTTRLTKGGPRFEFGLDPLALAQEMRSARVRTVPHAVWIEDSTGRKTWRSIDETFIAKVEDAFASHAGRPGVW